MKKITEDSGIGSAFKGIGIFVWIIGGLVSIIYIVISYMGHGSAIPGLLSLVAVFLSGLGFMGFGEIICLLKAIYATLKNNV